MRKIKIAPSIMCTNLGHLEDEVHKLEKAEAQLFHAESTFHLDRLL